MPRTVLVVTLTLSLAIVGLLRVERLSHRVQAAQSPANPTDQPVPLAVVDSMLVGGAKSAEAAPGAVTITRNSLPETARTGMLLYAGDEIATGSDAQLSILFLDNSAEKRNEVLIDANSRIQLGSVFTWLGRILVRVKGAFETRTPTSKLGVSGTEFDVTVLPDSSSTIKILEGKVSVEPAPLTRSSAIEFVPERVLRFQNAGFSAQERLGSQSRMDFVAVSGKETSVEREFVFTNSCQRKHLFQIRGPRNLEWFHLLGGDQFEISGNTPRSIKFGIKMDAKNVSAGVYEGEIIARCLDCNEEPGCTLGGLLLNVEIKVTGSGSGMPPQPSPTPTPMPSDPTRPAPTPGVTAATATKLQQIGITSKGEVIKTSASVESIDQTLAWSGNAIVVAQPSYAAEAVLPHFASAEERAERFRQARRSAILNSDAASYETLARIYVDWGNGAKAIDSFGNGGAAEEPDHSTTLGEAYRQVGKLDEAQSVLTATVNRFPEFAPAFIALGNVYVDRARIAQETINYDSAKNYLRLARDAYARVPGAISEGPVEQTPAPTLKATSTKPKNSHAPLNQTRGSASLQIPGTSTQVVAESNMGQAYLALGNIAKEQKQLSEALSQYQQAEQTLKRAEETGHHPFATKGLGDVYREIGNVSVMRGDANRSEEARRLSQQKYNQAIGAHNDFAEAFVGLGNLFEDVGRKDDAARAYLQATRVRPEQPAAFYFFAVAIADRNPKLAAAYAGAYLKAERPAFRQGEKTENAQRVNRGEAPIPRPTPTYAPPDQPPITPPVTPGPKATVKVPGVKGDKPDDALKKLEKKGLEGRIEERSECNANGRVLYTQPAKDELAEVGQMVVIYISSAGPNAVTVPKVTGLSRSEAEDELQRANLTARIVGTLPTNSAAPDTVVRQKPDPYKNKSKPGCQVELTLAVPIPKVEVPRYIGMTRADAFQRLPRFFGDLIRGDVIEVDRGDVAPGVVVDQSPKPGELVDKGTAVTLYISRSSQTGEGPYNVVRPRVPDVTRRSLQAAINELARQNLGYDTSRERGDYVVDQNPPPGTVVDPGYKVHLKLVYSDVDRTGPGPYIYRPPAESDLVDVPNVINMGLRQARDALHAHGLDYEIAGGDSNGAVYKQDPTAGPKKARRGQKVRLWFEVIGE